MESLHSYQVALLVLSSYMFGGANSKSTDGWGDVQLNSRNYILYSIPYNLLPLPKVKVK
jgi:hypothetical protein